MSTCEQMTAETVQCWVEMFESWDKTTGIRCSLARDCSTQQVVMHSEWKNAPPEWHSLGHFISAVQVSGFYSIYKKWLYTTARENERI